MNVLFVCDGNICRSPMAAQYLRHAAARSGLTGLTVDSAGLLGIENAPAAPYSIEIARDAGIDLAGHRSRGVRAADMSNFDLVIAMTGTHLAVLARRYPTGSGRRLLLRAFENGETPDEGAAALDDPVSGPIEGYRETFGIIRTCVDNLVAHLRGAP